MSGRFALMVVLALAGSAAIARAGDGDGDGGIVAGASQTKILRLPTHNACVRAGSIRVSIAPPRGSTLSSLTVRAGAKVVLQLSGLAGPGSVAVSLPRGETTRVAISATDAEGRFLENARSYRRCGSAASPPRATNPKPRPRPKPKPKRRPAPESESFQIGGGST